MRYKCPHCGNLDRSTIQDNGIEFTDPAFTLLCMALVRPIDSAIDSQRPDRNGLVECGMQWEPNQP